MFVNLGQRRYNLVEANEASSTCGEKTIAVATFAKGLTLNYTIGFAVEAAWKTFGGPQLPDGYVATGVAIAVPYAVDAALTTAYNLKEQFTKVKLASKTFGIAAAASVGILYSHLGGPEALSQFLNVQASDKPYGQDLARDLAQPVIETAMGFVAGTIGGYIAPTVGNVTLGVAGGVGDCFKGLGRALGRCGSALFNKSSASDDRDYHPAPDQPAASDKKRSIP